MHIPSNKILKSNALHRLNESQHAFRIVLIYSGILTAMSALVVIINHCLGLQISNLGGLSNMGIKSVLSTIQSVLPMIQSAIAMCLSIGYLAAMMRVSREQFASPQMLKLGFDRFWLLVRVSVVQYFIYMGLCFAACWIAAQIYMFTPFAESLMEIMAPHMSATSFSMDFLMDEAIYAQVMQAMIPMLVIFGVLAAAVLIPLGYSWRMVSYIIADKPGMGAMHILRESRDMMRGRRMRLFRLDLSLWWWYALQIGLSVLAYGDTILPALGIPLPFSETVGYFLFFFLFLAGQFALNVFLMNRVEVTYAQVYDKIRPREESGGAVLGNIFQM